MTSQGHRQDHLDPLPALPQGFRSIWDAEPLAQLLRDLSKIWESLLTLENEFQHHLQDTHVEYRRSARNLIHYMAFRRHDIRRLQEKLAALGLSSLGRNESHVATGIEAVLKILHLLAERPWEPPTQYEPGVDFEEGKVLLRRHTEAVLGSPPAKRGVRIMVTMPSEAARDYHLVRALLAHGMDCMRINCAHDDASTWAGMVTNLQAARQELGRECRIVMDLAGPKLRTGTIDPRSQVVKWRPQRDACGRVITPGRVWLTPAEGPEEPPVPPDGCLRIPGSLLTSARSGDRLKFTDLRGKSRSLDVGDACGCSSWAMSSQTAYLAASAPVPVIYVSGAGNAKVTVQAEVGAPPPAEQFIVLKPGDILMLTAAATPGTPAVYDAGGQLRSPATISCTLPEVFADVRPKERIWFDDGKIGGVVESAEANVLRVRITSARDSGEKLRADKGINLPDTKIRLPALTAKDIVDLEFVVRHADLVGLSFVRRPDDIRAIQKELARLNAQHLGIVLKIETSTGFEQLPRLLLAAMRGERVGVMIARGDLGVECGYERLAEVQEEILWVCEAAHIPVIWATQVLENLAKKGMPSRAEITDAAMGERAECVMLNKGPHLVEAVRVLDDILRRMEAHQSKKSARLRPLNLSRIAAT